MVHANTMYEYIVKLYRMSSDADSIPNLGELLHHTARVFSRWLDGLFEGAGASPDRARLVAIRHCSGPKAIAALADALEGKPRNITGLGDGLQAEGVLPRRAKPAGRPAR